MGCSESKSNQTANSVAKITDKNQQPRTTDDLSNNDTSQWPDNTINSSGIKTARIGPMIITGRNADGQSIAINNGPQTASNGTLWNYGGSNQQTLINDQSNVKFNPVDDPEAYYEKMKKQIEDTKKKRERDGVKRQIAERQLQKLAKEHPDLLQEKANMMIMNIDPNKIDKNTKVLPPLMTSNTVNSHLKPKASHGVFSQQSGHFDLTGNDEGTNGKFNLNINIGLNIQKHQTSIITNKNNNNYDEDNLANPVQRKQDLDDLLDELYNEVNYGSPRSNSGPRKSGFMKSVTENGNSLLIMQNQGLTPNIRLIKDTAATQSRKDLKQKYHGTSSVGTGNDDNKTELWSQNNMSSSVLGNTNLGSGIGNIGLGMSMGKYNQNHIATGSFALGGSVSPINHTYSQQNMMSGNHQFSKGFKIESEQILEEDALGGLELDIINSPLQSKNAQNSYRSSMRKGVESKGALYNNGAALMNLNSTSKLMDELDRSMNSREKNSSQKRRQNFNNNQQDSNTNIVNIASFLEKNRDERRNVEDSVDELLNL
eukprot:403339710